MRCWGIVTLGMAGAVMAAAAPITTGSLVEEMIDMRRLVEYPEPAYKTIQFSSYDRRSDLPGGADWFANSDGFGDEPVPNFEAVVKEPAGDSPGEYVICDVDGPGAIVRLWTAAIGGTIRMYLDGDETPVYDGAADEFFLHPYNSQLEGMSVTPELLDGSLYQRNAAYTPIPFAKHCRIVWTGNPKEIHFYEVQMRIYEPGTDVQTYSTEDLKIFGSRIRSVAEVLKNIDTAWAYESEMDAIPIVVSIAPGETQDAVSIGEGGALERLTLKVEAEDIDKALRQTVIHIHCDGSPWGEVQAPLGDFFGAAPGINPYTSVPFTVASDGTMTSRYVMPFKESLRILVENLGDQSVKVVGEASPMEYTWDDERSMYFRARWRVDHDLVSHGGDIRGAQDIPFLMAQGRGVYVGTSVMLLNPSTVPAEFGSWWGEGDEKIFVDNEAHPSIFGTGSEDYFNYAWSSPDIFIYPYCGQPRNDGPANNFFVTNYRWHVVDPLPFEQNIAFYMELFSHERVPGFSYARIAYHYAMPGVIDDHLPITSEDVRTLQRPQNWEPVASGGVRNSTFYAAEAMMDSAAENTAIVPGDMWQGGKLLEWTPANPGETLSFDFEIAEAGKYSLAFICRLAPGAGTFTTTLDGDSLRIAGGRPVSLATDFRTLSRVFGAPGQELSAGTHRVTISAESAEPIGVDFLKVQKH